MEDQVVDVKKRRKRQEYHKQYHLENSEKIQEHKKQYYLENNEKIKQYRLENSEKIEEYRKQYRLENSEKIKQYRLENKEKRKENTLKRNYGLTLDDYRKMLQEQNGSCAICFIKTEDTKKKYLYVDHNHLTGEVRGLLCSNCNTALGLLKENQETITNALKYLHEKGSCVLKEGR